MARIWFVTGVSGGLGEQIAAAALDRGDVVVGTVRRPDAVADFERRSPGRAFARVVDVSDRPAVVRVVDEVTETVGPVDLLVNNAGRALNSYVEDLPAEELRALFEVNVLGVLNCVQAVLPSMRARRAGHILNISSGAGIAGPPVLGAYSASKFALEGLTESLAAEVGGLGIKVTIVEPGAFRTRLQTTAARTVPPGSGDYGETAGRFRAYLERTAGHEDGDPARFADALLRIVDLDDPPARVAIGPGGLSSLQRKASALSEQARRSEQLLGDIEFGWPAGSND
jgi:NAD(P)-dependent dehydrogenase (short-subunit alcohol dehydrogenase family)